MADVKKIPLRKIFADSLDYCLKNWHETSLFSIANMIFLIIGFKIINAWHDFMFLLWLVPYYMFWYAFFRFYFGRKPYVMTKKIFGTLLPSTRILGLLLVFVTILIVLPLVIPFVCTGAWVETYVENLQKYIEDTQLINTVTTVILSVFSPIIFYRPMMAWIGSVIGRSSQMSTAYSRTKGNYWEFLLITVIFNLAFIGLDIAGEGLNLENWLAIFIGSPVVVYMNVFLAKTYEYFFMEID